MEKAWKGGLVLLIILLTFSACNKQTTTPVTEDSVQNEEADLSLYTYTSSFGYAMEYDPHLFYLLSDESSDRFDLIEADVATEPQVYLSVQRVSGYTVAEYLSLLEHKPPNGVYSVTETSFGAGGRDATTVTYEIDTDLGLVYYDETVIKVGSDLIYMEVVTYKGMPKSIQAAIEKMISTFSVEN